MPFQFSQVPATLKSSPGKPIVSAGSNHVEGIGFFATTTERDNIGSFFRQSEFVAFVGSDIYRFTGPSFTPANADDVMDSADWTDTDNWTKLNSASDVTVAIADVTGLVSALSTLTTDVSTNASGISTNSSGISTNAGDISTNETDIAANTGDISTNASGISTNASGISTNASGISTNASGISTNAAAISTNASGISTNAGSISTNASGISTNASDITAAEGDIATNTASISTNASGISTNASAISTNTTGISTNASDITAAEGDIATNTSAISTNASGISTNAGGISTNAAGISTNASDITAAEGDITTNASAISTNASAISTNASGISTNASGISTNATDITAVEGDVATNTSDISTNASGISTNASGISTNSTGISTNASDISSLQTDVSGNTSDISTNASGISTNATGISTNAAAIALKANTAALGTAAGQDVGYFALASHTHAQSEITDLTSDLSTLTTGVSDNATDISTNASGISTNASGISTNASAIALKADSSALGTAAAADTGDFAAAVHNHNKVDIQDFSDDDYTPEIDGLSETTDWGTDDDTITENFEDAMVVYHDGTGYKKASIFSLFQGLAMSVATGNSDLFGTQLGSAVNPLDFNGDGVVGAADLTQFLTAFGTLGNEFNESTWKIGIQSAGPSMDTYSSSSCQNPSMHLNINDLYTQGDWETFDIDMQNSNVTDGGATATLNRTTGSASTIYDTTSNEWVGFQQNTALESFHQFEDNQSLRAQIKSTTRLFWESNGLDLISFRVTVKGYDSGGTQLTFADGSDYEYVAETQLATNSGEYTYAPFASNQLFELEANSDLDSIRFYTEAASEYGKIASITVDSTYQILD